MEEFDKVQLATQYLQNRLGEKKPNIGLILGSGLGKFVDELEDSNVIEYRDIPHMKSPSVKGHSGKWVASKYSGSDILCMQGRLHYYEGYSLADIVFPIRMMATLGIDTLIITNACGGLNADYHPGVFMLLRDHINLMGSNPLIGNNENRWGPRFPDMSNPYNRELIDLAHSIGLKHNIPLHEGCYCAISGPNYLSKAELKMLQIIGADAVGMSTVPEVIIANHMGLDVLGISCVTDMAIPETLQSISHEEVVAVANKSSDNFRRLISGILEKL